MLRNDEMSTGGFSWGWIIFIILILWFFVGGGFGANNVRERREGDCMGRSNCQNEIDSLKSFATTNYNILENKDAIQMAMMTVQNNLGTKIDFYGYENLKDQLGQARDEITFLKTNANTDAKFNTLSTQFAQCCCELQRQIQAVSCKTIPAPAFVPAGGFYSPTSCGC